MVSEGRKCLQTAEKSIFMQIWAILAWATRKTPKNRNQTAPTHYLYVFEQVYNLTSSIFRLRHIMKEPNDQSRGWSIMKSILKQDVLILV